MAKYNMLTGMDWHGVCSVHRHERRKSRSYIEGARLLASNDKGALRKGRFTMNMNDQLKKATVAMRLRLIDAVQYDEIRRRIYQKHGEAIPDFLMPVQNQQEVTQEEKQGIWSALTLRQMELFAYANMCVSDGIGIMETGPVITLDDYKAELERLDEAIESFEMARNAIERALTDKAL